MEGAGPVEGYPASATLTMPKWPILGPPGGSGSEGAHSERTHTKLQIILPGQRGERAGREALGLVGIVSAVSVVAALLAAFVVWLKPAWTRIAVRVAGSWIAAIGLLLLGWGLRPTP